MYANGHPLSLHDPLPITLPNSLVWGNPIINYSRNATRRLDVEVSVRYGDDLELALRELGALVQNHQHVLPDLKPQVRSEENTSELQSLMRISSDVYCLKKKKTMTRDNK